MPTEFRLPELGENVEKGDLVKVLVSVGDNINKDQPVLELETDKATIEVPSTVSGRVNAIHVKAGDQVGVGQLILTVEDDAEAKAGVKEESPAPPEPRAKARGETEVKPEGKSEPKPKSQAKPQPAAPT